MGVRVPAVTLDRASAYHRPAMAAGPGRLGRGGMTDRPHPARDRSPWLPCWAFSDKHGPMATRCDTNALPGLPAVQSGLLHRADGEVDKAEVAVCRTTARVPWDRRGSDPYASTAKSLRPPAAGGGVCRPRQGPHGEDRETGMAEIDDEQVAAALNDIVEPTAGASLHPVLTDGVRSSVSVSSPG